MSLFIIYIIIYMYTYNMYYLLYIYKIKSTIDIWIHYINRLQLLNRWRETLLIIYNEKLNYQSICFMKRTIRMNKNVRLNYGFYLPMGNGNK